MDRAFRRRLIIVHGAIVLVIALGASTAFVALRSSTDDAEWRRAVDARLALIDRLRADTRELAQSARRYVLSGDGKEHQRVLAIVAAMKDVRVQLDARRSLAKGAVLEADLEDYVAALLAAMRLEDDDPIARFARFEDELVRIRAPIIATFDSIISHERSRREASQTARLLARNAQWAVLIASLLGAALVGWTLISVLRKLAVPPPVVGPPNELAMLSLRREACDAPGLVDRSVRHLRDSARERNVRLRYEAQLAIAVFVDRERVMHVLDSLLRVAIAAATPGTEIVVHVAAAEGGVRFAIMEASPVTAVAPDQDLALHFCKGVVEAHGGRMGVQTSAVSRTYWFTLPTEPSVLR